MKYLVLQNRQTGRFWLVAALIAAAMLLRPIAQAAPVTPFATTRFATTPATVANSTQPAVAKGTTATALTTSNHADLAITATAVMTTITLPAPIEYNVIITNTGPDAAQNVQVTFNILNSYAHSTIAGGSLPAGWQCETSANRLTRACTKSADLPTNAAEIFTFWVAARQGMYGGGTINAAVTTTTQDPNTANNNASPGNVTVIPEPNADIVINTASPAGITATTGSLLTLAWAGINQGPAATAITNTLQTTGGAHVIGSYSLPGYVCSDTSSMVTCLHSSSGYIYTLLLAPTTPGIYTQYLTATSALPDPMPSNNYTTTTITVEPAANQADLSLTAETDRAVVEPGSTVFYTLTVRNNGPAAATNVAVFVPMFRHSNPYLSGNDTDSSIPLAPSNWDCKNYLWGRGWLCKTAAMQNGEDARLLFRFYAPPISGSYTDTPGVGSATGDPDTSNNSAQATLTVTEGSDPAADIELIIPHLNDYRAGVLSGSQITIPFQTINHGPADAEIGYVGLSWEVAIGVSASASWAYVRHSAPPGWECTLRPAYAGGMDCFKRQLASGATEPWSVTLQSPAVGRNTGMNVCILTSSEQRNGRASRLCDRYNVTPDEVKMRLDAYASRDNPDPANAGGVISYTLVIHNDGPNGNASYPLNYLALTVPNGVTFQRLTGPGWGQMVVFPPTLSFSFPKLGAGESTTGTVVVMAPAVTGTITATAQIGGWQDYEADPSDHELLFTTNVALDTQAADLGVQFVTPAPACMAPTHTLTATLTNRGPDPAINPILQLTVPVGVQVTNSHSPDFQCTIDPTTGGATCQRERMGIGSSTIVFEWVGEAGALSAIEARLTSQTPDGNQFDNTVTPQNPCQPEIDVQGNGVSIDSGDSTPSLTDHTAFGTVATGHSLTHTFTISNSGIAAITGLAVTLNDANAFRVATPPPATIAAGSRSTFTVVFAPNAAGAVTATISIASNDRDENPYTFAVAGMGDAPPQATITIMLDTQPNNSANLAFGGSLGSFYLDDPASDDRDAYTRTRTFSVTPGRYTVRHNNAEIWFTSAIACTPTANAAIDLPNHDVTLTMTGGATVACTFTIQRSVAIHARAFNDLVRRNANFGKRNAGDPWLNGWSITVATAPNAIVVSNAIQRTGINDLYEAYFYYLRPGAYTVCATLPDNTWTPTAPSAIDPNYGQPCKLLTLTPGQTATLLFGAYQPAIVASANGAAQDELITNVDNIIDHPDELPEEETIIAESDLPRLFLPLINR